MASAIASLVTASNLHSRGKGPGWEFVHVAIADASRLAFAKVMNSERRRSATAFLKAALAYFVFRKLCKRLGLKHIRTKPLHAKNQRPGPAARIFGALPRGLFSSLNDRGARCLAREWRRNCFAEVLS
jgi:hypothetical protein